MFADINFRIRSYINPLGITPHPLFPEITLRIFLIMVHNHHNYAGFKRKGLKE